MPNLTDEQLLEFGQKAAAQALERATEGMTKNVREALMEDVRTEIARNMTPEALRGLNASTDEAADKLHVIKTFVNALRKGDHNSIAELAKSNEKMYFGLNKAGFSDITDGQGGYLVPEVWSNEIYSATQQFGFFRQLAQVIPMSTKTTKLSTGGGIVISYPDDNTDVTTTDATNYFSSVDIEAKRVAGAVIAKRDFIDDAQPNVIEFLTRETAKALAKEEDKQGFAGTGAPHTGIINTSGVKVVYQGGAANSGKTSFANISWKDLVDLSQNVEPDHQMDAAFFMSQAVFKEVRKEADANGRPINDFTGIMRIFNQFGITPKIGASAIAQRGYTGPGDFPIFVVPNGILPSDGAGRDAVTFGSLSQYAQMGVRKDMTQEVFNESYGSIPLSSRGLIAFATYQRKGFGFPVPSAYAVLRTATT
jgi:HK97 family phage major capsid protein